VDVGVFRALPLDLSKATKLKHLEFMQTMSRFSVQWITMALQTVKSENLQSITIYLINGFPETIEEGPRQGLRDLDRLLVKFWITHSIRPRITYKLGNGRKDPRDDVPSLLPELAERGLVDLVEIP